MGGSGNFFGAAVLQIGLSALLLRAASLGELDGSSKEGLNIGALMALDTIIGKIVKPAIELAVEDVNRNPSVLNATRLNLHIRDSTQDALEGASGEYAFGMNIAALDLLRKECVSIVGPQTSVVAEFVAYLGCRAQVPMVTFAATSPSLSMHRFPFFIRMAHSDSMQMKAIAQLIHNYRWRHVVLVYVDDDLGTGAIPALTDALRDIEAEIVHRAAIPPQANISVMRNVLEDELMKLESRVFIVHMHPDSGISFFSEADKLGMISSEYIWIITDGFASLLDSFNATALMSMHGVLGVKSKIPQVNQPTLKEFSERWKHRFRAQNPSIDSLELNSHALIAYDTVWAIAHAIDHLVTVGLFNDNFSLSSNGAKILDFRVFEGGKQLKEKILGTNFSGLSGPVRLSHEKGEPLDYSYDIVNVVGNSYRVVGSWSTEAQGLVMGNGVNWPGGSEKAPRGWVIPAPGKKLKIAVPWDPGFTQFISVKPVQSAAQKQTFEIRGFCIDVFEAVLKRLGYELRHELIPYGTGNVTPGYYDDLVYQVYLQKFDAVVGDLAVMANRSKYVDFTQPYTETGLVMTVRIDADGSRDPWAFLRPFTLAMWITTLTFFLFTGAVVWFLEHRKNKQFRGKPRKQFLTLLWFSFSTLFYTHRERVVSSMGKAVVIIWLFVVLVLVSSYTASLSSILTVKQIVPEVESVETLISKNLPIGYRQGTFIAKYLEQQLGVNKNLLREYSSVEEYAIALTKGPDNGGVAAIFEEQSVVQNSFLASGCNAYTKVGPTYRTGGFAFVFPKGSPLVSDVSKAILNLSESIEMEDIRKRWFNTGGKKCKTNMEPGGVEANRLSLHNFWGLFVITGCVSLLSLLYYLCRLPYRFLHRNDKPSPSHATSISTRLQTFAKYADQKEIPPPKRKRSEMTVWSYDEAASLPSISACEL